MPGFAWAAACLVIGMRASAQQVLLSEGFEAYAAGTYPPAAGWTTPNDSSGWYPTVSTNVQDTGGKSVVFSRYTDSLYSPTLDVSKADKVLLSFRVAQAPGLTYKAHETTDWWNHYFDLNAIFDGGATNQLFRDYGVLDGFSGSYSGTALQAPKVTGTAVAGFFAYEIVIDVAQASNLKLRFRGWQIDADASRKYYLDNVSVVVLPRMSVVIVR